METNEKLNKATEIRNKANELIGYPALIVPNGTIEWVKGWVKATQVDMRPKTPCILVVVEGEDGKLYRRTYGNALLKVDLDGEKRETKSRVKVPETLEELEEALSKANKVLEAAKAKVELLSKALEAAKVQVNE